MGIEPSESQDLGPATSFFAMRCETNPSIANAQAAPAIKTDTVSIAAFQIGMYAWMAVTFFLISPNPHLTAFDPRYWLMMQVAMICGFATSFPVNKWLIGAGIKEAM